MLLSVNELCPALGAEVIGLDVAAPMNDEVFGEIRAALCAHDGVLVLRDQHLTPEQHIVFSRRFGELFGDREQLQDSVTKYLLPGYPQIFRASNKILDGEQQGRSRAGNYFHPSAVTPYSRTCTRPSRGFRQQCSSFWRVCGPGTTSL